VFTAVDGTLLDFDTFRCEASGPMVRRFLAASIPVIPVSAMTLDEIEPIARELGLRHAMIIEAGGAIARWKEGEWEIEACGPAADTLLDVICEIEERTGAELTVYSVLPEAEAARLSGRSGSMLQLSTIRRFSEPFIVEKGSIDAVIKAAESLGFSVRNGRRFHHLCRREDEGDAFTRLRNELGCDVAIAVGGSALDASFLSRAEIPVVVPRPDGQPDPGLLEQVPHALVAPAPGSAGWATALSEVWAHFSSSERRV